MCVGTSKTYYAAPSKSLSLNRVLEGRDGLRVTLLGFLGTTTALEYFVTQSRWHVHGRVKQLLLASAIYFSVDCATHVHFAQPSLGLEGVMMRRKVIGPFRVRY